jgi:hypothetical protein
MIQQYSKYAFLLVLICAMTGYGFSLLAHENPISPSSPSSPSAKNTDGRVFEMRIYTTAEGRLDVLHKRFREHTNYLFVKHGMTLIGYWTPVEKPETLVYILAYPNMEARKKSWDGFMNDEAWKKAWADSKKDGPVVSGIETQFLNPTDYSPIR